MRKELKLLAITFAAIAIILKIAYYAENAAVAVRTAASLYWLFAIPGYAIMLNWKRQLGFLERVAIGSIAAMAITGITSYYLGIAGLKLQNQTIILPAAIIAVSVAAAARFSALPKTQPKQQEQKPQQPKA